MECLPGGPWADATGAAVPEAVGPLPWPGCCEAEEPGESGILAPLAGDRGERTVGRGTGQGAQRVSRRLSPALGAPENVSGGHLLLEGDVRGLGTPGTELFHAGPGSPSMCFCGPALGWNQECSKE